LVVQLIFLALFIWAGCRAPAFSRNVGFIRGDPEGGTGRAGPRA
jgi:hypothetical protein